jgi:hypothetical protein
MEVLLNVSTRGETKAARRAGRDEPWAGFGERERHCDRLREGPDVVEFRICGFSFARGFLPVL